MPILKPKCQLIVGDCVEVMRRFREEERTFSLVLGSPEYPYKGHRYIDGEDNNWNIDSWVDWMSSIIWHSVKIAPVAMFVVNDSIVKGQYIPCVGMLEAIMWRRGVVAERPLIWDKNSPPNRVRGKEGQDWWSNAHERIIAFKASTGPVPVFNWTSIATPRQYEKGGAFKQRGSDGERRQGSDYPTNELVRPKDIIRATVGGGHMGHRSAHENEAPFPERLVEPIITALTNKGGSVFDPFCGSGTTLAVALQAGRHATGCDIRASQVELTRDRILDECGIQATVEGRCEYEPSRVTG